MNELRDALGVAQNACNCCAKQPPPINFYAVGTRVFEEALRVALLAIRLERAISDDQKRMRQRKSLGRIIQISLSIEDRGPRDGLCETRFAN